MQFHSTVRWLDSTTASRLLGIDASTLRKWSRGGRVRAWRTRGGRFLYERAEVLALLPRVVTPGRKGVGRGE